MVCNRTEQKINALTAIWLSSAASGVLERGKMSSIIKDEIALLYLPNCLRR